MEKIKLLICGLPGSGKTTLARELSKEFRCVWFNGDDIRLNINKDLTFSLDDRLEQARRMGFLCDIVLRSQDIVVADFVCPTEQTRAAFSPTHIVFMDTIQSGRFEDTNRIFEKPANPTYHVKDFEYSFNSIIRSIHS